LIGSGTPWEGGAAHKQWVTRSRDSATLIGLVRDSGSGQVKVDREGNPVIHYWPNRADQRLLMRAMVEAARITCAGGATEASTFHTPALRPRPETMPDFEREVERRGVVPNRLTLFTAHQMGSCRLGADPRTSVADPEGQVHGIKGVYIVDASAFPSASGVNPMLSTMALAHRTAQHIKGKAG
jgi:choline dehydrogenase-like flavoprotein